MLERDVENALVRRVKKLGGTLIQDAMPNLSPDDREFLMTGITEEEWSIMDEEYEEFDEDYDEDEDYV